ncbi:unnamed protein product [Diatraea saccharalis]|uniref:Uncharacterized protein n=1 Tax=Diatraea saccharalis TaxID=40085 RepID=A0A9N9WIE1_9NEOP|nr:unnamed protein product [Diatraea saccharalis]
MKTDIVTKDPIVPLINLSFYLQPSAGVISVLVVISEYRVSDRIIENKKTDSGDPEEKSTRSGGNVEQIKLDENQSNYNPHADDRSQTVNTNITAVLTICRQKHPTKLFETEKAADEQTDHLMVSDYRRPWTPSTPERLQARCRPWREGLRGRRKGVGRGWASGTLTHTTKHNASFASRRFSVRLMHDIDAMCLGLQNTKHSESSSPVPTLSPQQHAIQFIVSRKSSYSQYKPRPGTSSSSYCEPIIQYSPVSTSTLQPQHTSQFMLSHKSSHNQYAPRPGNSSSSHSEPIIYYSPVPNSNVMEPRQRASREQFSIMIEFMERHGDILRPHPGVQGRLKSDQMWKEVTVLLNSVGGGVQKSADKWKKRLYEFLPHQTHYEEFHLHLQFRHHHLREEFRLHQEVLQYKPNTSPGLLRRLDRLPLLLRADHYQGREGIGDYSLRSRGKRICSYREAADGE